MNNSKYSPRTACDSRTGQHRPSVLIGMVYIRTGIEELADADIISAQSGHYQVFHIAIVWCQGASRMAWAVVICRSRPRLLRAAVDEGR